MQNGENRHGTERDKDDHNNLIPHRISIAMGGSIGRWGIRPPQLAASFFSNQACNVAYWPILLKKSEYRLGQIFSAPWVRFSNADVEALVISPQTQRSEL